MISLPKCHSITAQPQILRLESIISQQADRQASRQAGRQLNMSDRQVIRLAGGQTGSQGRRQAFGPEAVVMISMIAF